MNKIFILLIFIFLINFVLEENFTTMTELEELFEQFMENNYQEIFPEGTNRNAAGFAFFNYFYNMPNMTHELFKKYNQFYCSVSGSIVAPRTNNYNIIKIMDLESIEHTGKYYRCCTPCISDIMRYTRIVETNLTFNGITEKYKLITIKDPCNSDKTLPEEVDKSILNCEDNKSSNSIKVNTDGTISEDGRMVIGILYPITEEEMDDYDITLDILNTEIEGNKRICTDVDDLKYGMGDIFVKLALMNKVEENDNIIINKYCN